jgi:hypothetical protein
MLLENKRDRFISDPVLKVISSLMRWRLLLLALVSQENAVVGGLENE